MIGWRDLSVWAFIFQAGVVYDNKRLLRATTIAIQKMHNKVSCNKIISYLSFSLSLSGWCNMFFPEENQGL